MSPPKILHMKRYLILSAISCMLFSVMAGAQDLVILHTNDTHSHVDPVRAGEYAGMGGVIERAVFVVDERRRGVQDFYVSADENNESELDWKEVFCEKERDEVLQNSETVVNKLRESNENCSSVSEYLYVKRFFDINNFYVAFSFTQHNELRRIALILRTNQQWNV